MKYYLKKCGFQELGSVGPDGKANRGRYLLTSMNNEVLEFFPPLSTAQLNDSQLLPIIPLYSGQKVYCSYVYHNDKFHDSPVNHPRNEYRIYLNKALEGDSHLFETDDIIVMRQKVILNEDGTQQTVYLMDLYKKNKSSIYNYLDTKIQQYPIRGGYGISEEIIAEFEQKAAVIGELSVVVDKSVTERISDTTTEQVADLFNPSTFRDFVMVGYNGLCAISGTVISYQNYKNLEAAHIKPKSHGGLFHPNNGIALCRDLHWAFDKGFFSLNDNYEVIVHELTTSDFLRSFNGIKIRIPTDDFFRPNLSNIQYHRNTVFGLFLTTGRL
jgi:hypothetical protein